MIKEMPEILTFYSEKVSEMIMQKYGLEQFAAFRKFLDSKTYHMLSNEELEMWDFSPIGIFDMWEAEQVTGSPQASLYLRRD